MDMQKFKLDIEVHPTQPEPKISAHDALTTPDGKRLKIWKFPWRINMLAKAKPPTRHKYEPPPPYVFKTFGDLDEETAFRASHLCRPLLRTLNENRRNFKDLHPSYWKDMTKIIEYTWESIYHYYDKKFRDKRLKALKQRLVKLLAKKPKGKELAKIMAARQARVGKLATPKKRFFPAKKPHKWLPLEKLLPLLETLALPKERNVEPPKEIGKVTVAALLYQVTDIILKLAHPKQLMATSEPRLLGVVSKAALKAKCSERVANLAQPSLSAREAKKQAEDDYDPWAISPTALKYKATARILELAKPLERD